MLSEEESKVSKAKIKPIVSYIAMEKGDDIHVK